MPQLKRRIPSGFAGLAAALGGGGGALAAGVQAWLACVLAVSLGALVWAIVNRLNDGAPGSR